MRFGVIVPSSNTTMETEFWKLATGWATVHTARMPLEKITLKGLQKMEQEMLSAAVRLADAQVNIIGYGCTSGSLYKGREHASEIERKITEKTRIPAVATAQAVIEAMGALQINKVSVATPYMDEINQLEKKFLEQNSIDVLKIKGLNIVDNLEVGRKDPRTAYELAQELYTSDTQGLFISCTNFRTIEIIDQLEKELSIPVLSSNTATFWAMMRKAGSRKKLEEYGRLFQI